MDSQFEQMRVLREQWAAQSEEIKIYRSKIEKNSQDLAQQLDLLLRAEERPRSSSTYLLPSCVRIQQVDQHDPLLEGLTAGT